MNLRSLAARIARLEREEVSEGQAVPLSFWDWLASDEDEAPPELPRWLVTDLEAVPDEVPCPFEEAIAALRPPQPPCGFRELPSDLN